MSSKRLVTVSVFTGRYHVFQMSLNCFLVTGSRAEYLFPVATGVHCLSTSKSSFRR